MREIIPGDKDYESSSLMIKRLCRSYKTWNKCFGIGLNKTGTTSLNVVMTTIFGYRSKQREVEANSTRQMILGNYQPFVESMQNLDFHQDLPVSQGDYYVALDALFPGSKFILTTRDGSQWMKSFMRQYEARLKQMLFGSNKVNKNYIFPGYTNFWLNYFWGDALSLERRQMTDLDFNSISVDQDRVENYQFSSSFFDFCVNKFQARNERVFHHFSGRPDDLLVLDLSLMKDVGIIRDFLGLPDCFTSSLPHENRLSKFTKPKSPPLYISSEFAL